MPEIGFGGYARIFHPPRENHIIPSKYKNNSHYIQRYTDQTMKQIQFGERARKIFDPDDKMSSPILDIIERSKHHVSEILPFRTGTLSKFLRETRSVRIDTVMKVVIPILHGLVRLHKRRIIHHDIKSSNILYDMRPIRLYLIDWGTACTFNDAFTGRYSNWLSGHNENHPPEYKMVANSQYHYEYDDIVEEYSNNYYYRNIISTFQPDYDRLLQRTDRDIRKQLQKDPHLLDKYAGRIDVFAMGIVLAQIVLSFKKSDDDFLRYRVIVQNMLHPDPRKRWSMQKTVNELEKLVSPTKKMKNKK